MLIMKKADGNIHDRFVCSVYLRVTFISLTVDVGGDFYSRMAFIQWYCLIK